MVVIVALAIGLALAIQQWFVKPFQIPSGSMIPTLDIDERVLVNRFSHVMGGDPDIGDIVVFNPPVTAEMDYSGPRCTAMPNRPDTVCPEPDPRKSDDNFIKRVVAGPGDRLRIENGHPVVNGEIAEENFIRPCRGLGDCNLREEITIPPDHYFMMGDNRGASQDSRFWGPVPRDWIIGEAFFTYWPIDKVGLF
ncbi:MAG: signal peptidase I [Solirubrobacterales bacterium]